MNNQPLKMKTKMWKCLLKNEHGLYIETKNLGKNYINHYSGGLKIFLTNFEGSVANTKKNATHDDTQKIFFYSQNHPT